MLKKSILIITVLLLLVSGANAQEPINIGAVFDLSGATSEVGRPYAEGVAAYFEFLNANGGINGQPVALGGADFGGTTSNAEQLYVQLAGQGIVLFMGWGTEDTEALVNRAASDQIPVLSAAYSEALNDPFGSAPYNFIVAPTYGDQLEILLTHMVALWENQGGSAGDMSVAIFHDDNDFGTDPLRQGTDAASALGIGGLLSVRMPRNATDFTAELQQADDYGITHVIIQSTPSTAAVLARNVESFFGSGAVQIGCLNWCADEQFISRAGSAAEGALGVQPFTPVSVGVSGHDDIRDFVTSQGVDFDSLSVHFVQGWTMASIAAAAAETTLNAGLDLTGANLRAALESFDDFETGDLIQPITFGADDHVGTRASAVFVVSGGEWALSSNVIDLR